MYIMFCMLFFFSFVIPFVTVAIAFAVPKIELYFEMFIHVQFVCFSNKHENKPELAKDRNAISRLLTKPEICLNICRFVTYI